MEVYIVCRLVSSNSDLIDAVLSIWSSYALAQSARLYHANKETKLIDQYTIKTLIINVALSSS